MSAWVFSDLFVDNIIENEEEKHSHLTLGLAEILV